MANQQGRISIADSESPPRSVEQITKAAHEYEYSAQVPVRYWLRTAAALLKEADIYMREGVEDTAYLLLFRHAHLILTNLMQHPGSRDPAVKQQLKEAQASVNGNLQTMENLKPRINQKYERYSLLQREREARRKVSLSVKERTTRHQPILQESQFDVQHLRGAEHSELAVKLAQREITRRADARQVSGQSHRTITEDRSAFAKRLESIQPRESHLSDKPPSRNYSYPIVRSHEPRSFSQTQTQSYGAASPAIRPQYTSTQTTALSAQPLSPPPPPPPPIRPPKFDSSELTVPPRPQKISVQTGQDSTARELAYTFTSTASLEGGAPLRTLFLPPTLRTTFLRIAHKNTTANLETCAFLAGTLISNALFVSKLIVPAQIATSDTCEMTNESQLFDYVDSEQDLMILGWIHTHPSQTCFMSSRDLHTHAGYQMMLPESIAIVCAPSKGDTVHGGDWGAYRLTDPPGKMAILNCDKPGIFHPHDVDNVYTDALRPGHVVEAPGLEFELVDLRSEG